MAVAAVAVSPLAALQADAAVTSGPATASGPGVAVENTGGNVELGVGHSESKVVLGDGGGAAPLAVPNGLSTLSTPAADPNAAAVARARALVAAAKARAEAQKNAALAHAQEVIDQARQQAEDAQAHSAQQSSDARARAESSSASASSSTSD